MSVVSLTLVILLWNEVWSDATLSYFGTKYETMRRYLTMERSMKRCNVILLWNEVWNDVTLSYFGTKYETMQCFDLSTTVETLFHTSLHSKIINYYLYASGYFNMGMKRFYISLCTVYFDNRYINGKTVILVEIGPRWMITLDTFMEMYNLSMS